MRISDWSAGVVSSELSGGSTGGSAFTEPVSRLEEGRVPGVVALFGVEVLAGQQGIAVDVPFAARKVVAEHGRRRLGFVDDAHGEVAFDQAVQCFRHVGGGLVALDRKSTRLNTSHLGASRLPSSA